MSACIAACEADAGLPARDAAANAVGSLASALDTCVDTSCASQCPGAANDLDDRDGVLPFAFDGSFPHCDGGSPFSPPSFGDAGGFAFPFGGRR